MELITVYILPFISIIANKVLGEFIVNKFFKKNKESNELV